MTPETAGLTLRHTGADESLELRQQILPVYAAARADRLDKPWYSPDNFWSRLVDIHSKARDFDLVTGWVNGEVIGYAFGSPQDTEDLWDKIHHCLPHLTPTGPVYIFREFAVHPSQQRRGYGAKIHRELLRPRREQAAHLLVRPDNEAARAAYHRWGWVKVGTNRPFQDSTTFDALALDLQTFKSNQ